MEYLNLVGGEWIEGAEMIRNINPSDRLDVIGDYAFADQTVTEQAIAAARSARHIWSRFPSQARAECLDRIGAEVLARKDELGRLLAREEGKSLSEAVGEVTRAGHIFRFYAGEVLRSAGSIVPSLRPDITVEVTREPVGVVGLVTPWNFPIAIPAWKIAPALAYGNCVLFKPAELVPGSAWALAEIISRSGIPPGVFNLVMGRGSVVGDVIARSPDVDAISFTGSQTVGKLIAQNAARRLARVQLEMGGKNPQVILDDAHLDTAVAVCVQSAFYSTGQRCTAASRFIVTEGIHDQFVSALCERMRQLRVGHALAPDTDIGPVVDERQLEKNLEYVRLGMQEGARLLQGGQRIDRDTDGYFMAPALFVETASDMRINREEIFGPVAGVIRVRDYEEALAVANDTPFGLSAGIATTSLRYATHFKRNVEAGMVMVNAPTAGVDYHVPFGGRKQSSHGPREQGSIAAEFYTTVKTTYLATH